MLLLDVAYLVDVTSWTFMHYRQELLPSDRNFEAMRNMVISATDRAALDLGTAESAAAAADAMRPLP